MATTFDKMFQANAKSDYAEFCEEPKQVAEVNDTLPLHITWTDGTYSVTSKYENKFFHKDDVQVGVKLVGGWLSEDKQKQLGVTAKYALFPVG